MEFKKIGNYLYYPEYIGKGSFSKVYKGYHIDNKNEVLAIKKIYISNPKIRNYIEQEISVMKQIDNENILKLYNVEYTMDYIYLILEYCDNDLYTYLKKNNITYEKIRFFMKQLINGLKYIVDKNIVHRDLKPQNILITNNNILKICDFGFAKEIKNENMISTMCGSPLYMAPEIIDKNQYNIKSDIWSVGIILYEMCMKIHPFKSDNIKELIEKINNKKIKIYYNKDIPINCKKLIKKLLQIKTKKRITWNELFNDKWINNLDQYNNSSESESEIESETESEIESETETETQSENKIENKQQNQILNKDENIKFYNNDFDDSFEIFSLDLYDNNNKKQNDYIVIDYDEVENKNNIKDLMSNSISILKKFLEI
tara:strand:+ start:3257 stop:4375 length:1119 start_codon:yes stop_codon:yes gene_type:complete